MPCSAWCVMSPHSLTNFCQIKTRATSPAWDTGMVMQIWNAIRKTAGGACTQASSGFQGNRWHCPQRALLGGAAPWFYSWKGGPPHQLSLSPTGNPWTTRSPHVSPLPCNSVAKWLPRPQTLVFLTCKLDLLVCVHACSHVRLFVTPWIVAHQAPLFMGFFRQEYWGGWLFSPPRDLSNSNLHLLCLLR